MEILGDYRFILVVIAFFLVVVIGLPFVFKEIRKKRRAGELADRIIPLSTLTEADIEKIRSLHPGGKKTYPAVNRGACVGCGSCVQGCKEKTVLAIIRGKSTIVNPLACRCCGDCERNCLTGALKIIEHGNKIKVRIPWIDENFQSNIKGIYVVGSLTGAGLIKEAINQGRAAVNHILKGVFPPDLPKVMVVGAGPAGLSAMLSCRKFGLPVICFEKDLTANTIRNFPKKKILMAEPVEMPIAGPLWVGDTSREKLLEAWERMLAKAGACISTGSRLEKIENKDGRFQVTISGKTYSCDTQETRNSRRRRRQRVLQPAGSRRVYRQHGHGHWSRRFVHRSIPGLATQRLPSHHAGPGRWFFQGQGQEPGAHRTGWRSRPDQHSFQQPAAGDRH
jgi:ferredoxin